MLKFQDMTIDQLLAFIFAFFDYEVNRNPKLYAIEMLFIPTLNAVAYIDKRIEYMRQRLAKSIIKVMLKRQQRDSKIFLFKIINDQLIEYFLMYKKQVLREHLNAWYTICELEEEFARK